MTYTFIVQMDLHEGEKRVNPTRVARAIARVINHAMETDIADAEILDTRWGQVSVQAEPGASKS